mgnify:CR=1 FL=1
MKIAIMNGRLVDAKQSLNQQASLYIDNDKIVGIADAPSGFVADKSIDATGLIVCAGFIELNAQLPDIQAETQAAAAAGFTGLCLPPNTKPIIDTTASIELIKDKAEHANYPFIYPIAALTQALAGKELTSMQALKQANCIAVSHAQAPLQDVLVLRRAMEYAATQNLLLIYCPQDGVLSVQGCAHDGAMATRYGLPSIPVAAETIALTQCIELVAETGCRVHIHALSCARSVSLIANAKQEGLPISADVAMHQLHLSDADMIPYDSAYHVLPPLRSPDDKAALLNAVKANMIDCICSDHQPHDIDAKLGAFPETAAGISSLETSLPLLLVLVNQGHLTLDAALAKLNNMPADILGLGKETGCLAVGYRADICIFNPDLAWQVNDTTWRSQGKNTPYWQQTLQGKVVYTLQAGHLIYQP